MATGRRAGDGGPNGRGLFAQWHALIDAGDPRFTLLATVDEAVPALAQVEAATWSSVWNMQRHATIHSLAPPGNPLDERTRRKGVELRYVLPRRVAERRFPMASSHYDYLRLAPVAHPLLISDRRLVLVGDAAGETLWTSTDPQVVAAAVDFFERVWHSATPAVPEGQEPPFTRRMVDVAALLVHGATDREIARSLGVSERTVSADVREMSRRLGARSRAHAIALIAGVTP